MTLRSTKSKKAREKNAANVPWLIQDAAADVLEEDLLSVLLSKPRCESFCEELVHEILTNMASCEYQRKCLSLLISIVRMKMKRRQSSLVCNSLMLAGILGGLMKVMETWSGDVILMRNATYVVASLLKNAIPGPVHFSRIDPVVQAMTLFPHDEFLQYHGIVSLFLYSQRSPQRMKKVIDAGGLEVVATACSNYEVPRYRILSTSQTMLRHMAVSFSDALMTTQLVNEVEFSLV